MAEVGQMKVDVAWQAEMINRLDRAEEEQEKQKEQLVNLNKRTRAKEEVVFRLMQEVEGKQVHYNLLSVSVMLQVGIDG